MRRDLEALLFAADEPLSLSKLAVFFPDVDREALRNAVGELREEYDRDEHAFTVVEFGGGFSIATRPEYAPVVKKLFRGRRKLRLSKASLEVLSIIAYKQPVTRLEIEEIRGVSASGVLGTLMERELVQIVGRAEGLGNPLLYGTTRTFLDYLGLRDLKELPKLSELADLLEEREQLKQLAADRGEEVGDEAWDAVLAAEEEGDEDFPADPPEADPSSAAAPPGEVDDPTPQARPEEEGNDPLEESTAVADEEASLPRGESA
jgi:segregation and condensation protein B